MNFVLATFVLIVYFLQWQAPCLASFELQQNSELVRDESGQLVEVPSRQNKPISISNLVSEVSSLRVPLSQRQYNSMNRALPPTVPRRQVCFCCRAYVCQYQRCPCSSKFFL